MTDAELESVRRCLETATKVGRARHEEMFRAVGILQERARLEEPLAARALLQAAAAILNPKYPPPSQEAA